MSRSPEKPSQETLKRDLSNPNANCVQARANQRQLFELSVLLQPCNGANR